MIGRGGERGSGISMLVARHDDDDDDDDDILAEAVCISHNSNTFRKRMNLTIIFPAIGK